MHFVIPTVHSSPRAAVLPTSLLCRSTADWASLVAFKAIGAATAMTKSKSIQVRGHQ